MRDIPEGQGTNEPGDDVVKVAMDRFKACEEWEQDWRNRFLQDYKFAEADADNGYQWPNDIQNGRELEKRPTLTINKTRQHNLQIINEGKKNKPGVKIRPVNSEASFQAAQMLENIIRHVEYQSNAQQAYDTAMEFQVKGGMGYWYITTEYSDDLSFSQDVFIKRINDPMSVYLDPDIKEFDGSDARFGFIIQEVPRRQFDLDYPKWKDKGGLSAPLGHPSGKDWFNEDYVRIALYFSKDDVQDELLAFQLPQVAPAPQPQQQTPQPGMEAPPPGMPGVEAPPPGMDPGGMQGMPTEMGSLPGAPQMPPQAPPQPAMPPAPQGPQVMLASKLGAELTQYVKMTDPMHRSRPVTRQQVTWRRIIGEEVESEGLCPGTYIPIVRVPGEETVIEGKLDRKGHTRAMKDPQRMYNWWASAGVEHVAMQSISPWVVPGEAIEGYETFWRTANTTPHAFLPVNHRDDNNEIIPPPVRPTAPSYAPAYIDGMKLSQMEMMMVSGQYQSEMGAPSNERSARAINERQAQGDTATYHFVDNLSTAIRFTGKILLEYIAATYDTKRVMKVVAEDNTEIELIIDPQAKQAYQQQLDRDGKVAMRILNPAVGKYEVRADVGPGYSTKRQEAFNAFTQILSQSPELTSVIGDIMMRAADFPMADEAAERLKRMTPPQALGQGPTPEVQQLQQQLANLTESLKQAMNKLGAEQSKAVARDEKQDIAAYSAETQRFAAIKEFLLNDQEGMKQVVQQLVHDALSESLAGVFKNKAPMANLAPPAPAAPMPMEAANAPV